MPNHFHLVVQLTQETLSRGMQWLNARYSQTFNRRHQRVGHLYQGRFDGRIIEKESYFLEVLRYTVLNPVRAKMVARPEEYVWSSHRALIGEVAAPAWLATDDVLVHFGSERAVARTRYQRFVEDGMGAVRNPWTDLVGQIYLGSENWIQRVQGKIDLQPRVDEHPVAQRAIGKPTMSRIVASVAEVLAIDEGDIREGRGGIPRMIAAWLGCREGMLTNGEIKAGLRLQSSSRVTQLVKQFERELAGSDQIRTSVDRCLSTLRRKSS